MSLIFKAFIGFLSFIILLLSLIAELIIITEKVFYSKPDYTQVSKNDEINSRINQSENNIVNVLEEKVINGQKITSLSKTGWTTTQDNFIFNPKLINPSTTIANSFFSRFSLNKYRYKKWDAYCFVSKNYAGTFAVFNFNYLGGVLFHLTKINDPTFEVITYKKLDPRILPEIPDICNKVGSNEMECTGGLTDTQIKNYFSTGNEKINNFSTYRNSNKNHIITFAYSNEETGFSVEFDVKLQGKDLDSIVTLTPMIEDGSLFYFNNKSYGLKPTGKIKINKEEISTKDFHFTYDAGRGAWPLKSGWVWVSIGGETKNKETFSFNSGHGFTHHSAKFTEDCFFIKGKLYKLYNLKYNYSENLNEHGLKNIQLISQETEKKEFCDLTFHITKEKNTTVNVILGEIIFHVSYGFITGSCFDDKGKEYEIEYATGIMENKLSLW